MLRCRVVAGFAIVQSGEVTLVIPGTFSHRHAVVHDQKSERALTPPPPPLKPPPPFKFTAPLSGTHCPLKLVNPATPFVISNSHLSEMGVLGFEYDAVMIVIVMVHAHVT